MPVHETKGGYKYGKTGKTYKDKKSAIKQAVAIAYSQARKEGRKPTKEEIKAHISGDPDELNKTASENLSKTAASPAMLAGLAVLAGAGIGGTAGYFLGEKDKKLLPTLTGALIGGVGSGAAAIGGIKYLQNKQLNAYKSELNNYAKQFLNLDADPNGKAFGGNFGEWMHDLVSRALPTQAAKNEEAMQRAADAKAIDEELGRPRKVLTLMLSKSSPDKPGWIKYFPQPSMLIRGSSKITKPLTDLISIDKPQHWSSRFYNTYVQTLAPFHAGQAALSALYKGVGIDTVAKLVGKGGYKGLAGSLTKFKTTGVPWIGRIGKGLGWTATGLETGANIVNYLRRSSGELSALRDKAAEQLLMFTPNGKDLGQAWNNQFLAELGRSILNTTDLGFLSKTGLTFGGASNLLTEVGETAIELSRHAVNPEFRKHYWNDTLNRLAAFQRAGDDSILTPIKAMLPGNLADAGVPTQQMLEDASSPINRAKFNAIVKRFDDAFWNAQSGPGAVARELRASGDNAGAMQLYRKYVIPARAKAMAEPGAIK